MSLILPTRGVVAEGERIIAQGEVVDQRRFQILNSLRVEYLSDLLGLKRAINYCWLFNTGINPHFSYLFVSVALPSIGL